MTCLVFVHLLIFFFFRCEHKGCNGLLRPAVVWFGEALDADIINQAEKVLDNCDLCLVVCVLCWKGKKIQCLYCYCHC